MNYSMAITAKKLSANWGAALIDVLRAWKGTARPVAARAMHIAIASPDFSRQIVVALETMGSLLMPSATCNTRQSSETGQFDLAKIEHPRRENPNR